MASFFGQYEHSVDPKGRLILPAKFRSQFDVGGSVGFLSQHTEGCLALYTPDEFDIRMAQMRELAQQGPAERNMVRFWSSGTAQVEIDKQGRMALPNKLREYADLTPEGPVLVVGAIERVELWNPIRWEEKVGPEEERLIQGGVIA
ncbi:MAG: division/cell wall cluster transcriptional repressor MraZ [Acidimicrobiales bacterium]